VRVRRRGEAWRVVPAGEPTASVSREEVRMLCAAISTSTCLVRAVSDSESGEVVEERFSANRESLGRWANEWTRPEGARAADPAVVAASAFAGSALVDGRTDWSAPLGPSFSARPRAFRAGRPGVHRSNCARWAPSRRGPARPRVAPVDARDAPPPAATVAPLDLTTPERLRTSCSLGEVGDEVEELALVPRVDRPIHRR
jgi:hypothetical protein